MIYANLKNKEVVPVNEAYQVDWSPSARRVAETSVEGQRISTVFLCINHGWGDKPLWFETMIFEGPHDGYQERYETWAQAEEGHARAVKIVKE